MTRTLPVMCFSKCKGRNCRNVLHILPNFKLPYRTSYIDEILNLNDLSLYRWCFLDIITLRAGGCGFWRRRHKKYIIPPKKLFQRPRTFERCCRHKFNGRHIGVGTTRENDDVPKKETPSGYFDVENWPGSRALSSSASRHVKFRYLVSRAIDKTPVQPGVSTLGNPPMNVICGIILSPRCPRKERVSKSSEQVRWAGCMRTDINFEVTHPVFEKCASAIIVVYDARLADFRVPFDVGERNNGVNKACLKSEA